MTLHVESIGAGAPLVLLHGWGFHSAVWQDFADALAQRYCVRLVDLPGHGHSRGAHFGDLNTIADEVAAITPGESILCGWSLGGIVAQQVARRHPTKARALALVGTTPCFVAREEWKCGIERATLDAFAQGLRRDPSAALEEFVHLNAFGATAARATVRSISRRLSERPYPSDQALDAGLEMLRSTDLRDDASGIGTKTIVIHGSRDRVVPVGAGRWLASALPRARLVELPRSAHLPFVTERDAAIAAVSSLDD